MAHFDTTRKGSVNVELNIIPFVDVMSCLTAFLLVTAAWLNLAHLQNAPVGKGTDTCPAPCEHRALGVRLDYDQIVVVRSPDLETRFLPAHDWAALATTLTALAAGDDTRPRVEIAASSTNAHPISYQTIIAAMDATVKAGFQDVGVIDPDQLAMAR